MSLRCRVNGFLRGAAGSVALAAVALPVAAGNWEDLHPVTRGTIPAWSAPQATAPGSTSLNATSASLPSKQLGLFSIVIVPGPTLSSNAPALAAFNRAAQDWQSRFTDPVTVTINADLAPLGPSIIGDTAAVTLQGTYDEVRGAMVLDGADEPSNLPITAALPTSANYSVTIPPGRTLNPQIALTKANAKALGFTGLDAQFGNSDALIRFSSTFAFDYDNSNGVSVGQMDFQTVAAHEIGHVLGFISGVDDVNDGADPVQGLTLDLFRFANNAPGRDPSNLAEFAIFPRDLIPGQDAVFDDTLTEYGMSTGLGNVQFPGTDNRQASHWKADELTGSYVGIMDPTLQFGTTEDITAADLRAMDLIGYDLAVPEPTGVTAIAVGVLLTLRRRRAG
jgi:hypothetical protein